MNWCKLKEHEGETYTGFTINGDHPVQIPSYHKATKPHMIRERATKKRRFRIKNGKKVYIESLVV